MPAAHKQFRAYWRPASENLQGRKPREWARTAVPRAPGLWGFEGLAWCNVVAAGWPQDPACNGRLGWPSARWQYLRHQRDGRLDEMTGNGGHWSRSIAADSRRHL
jgi:hypothetical protein